MLMAEPGATANATNDAVMATMSTMSTSIPRVSKVLLSVNQRLSKMPKWTSYLTAFCRILQLHSAATDSFVARMSISYYASCLYLSADVTACLLTPIHEYTKLNMDA